MTKSDDPWWHRLKQSSAIVHEDDHSNLKPNADANAIRMQTTTNGTDAIENIEQPSHDRSFLGNSSSNYV